MANDILVNKLKTKRLLSSDLLGLIYNGIRKNAENKKTWRCTYCDDSIPHFHASSVGYCQRKLQYFIEHGMQHNRKNSEETEAFLRDGHINENIVKEGLIGSGVKLFYHDAQIKKVGDVILVMNKDIMFEYNYAGYSTSKYIIEQKSLKDTNYKKIIKDRKLPEWYIDQIQMYLDFYNIQWGFILLKCRSSSDMFPFPVELDVKRVKKIYAKLQNIMNHVRKKKLIDRPYPATPYKDKPLECKVCQFYKECWGSIYE